MATNTEQLFQSKHLATDIEHIWDGAILSNSEQNLSELEKATARENIGAVAFGTAMQILGHYDTVVELQNVPEPKVGDAYSVGTIIPYNLYIFDGLRNDWLDYGAIRATDISARYAENKNVIDWVHDESLSVEYQYKGKILIDGISKKDFPIVAFNPKEAVSGNYSPICFAFDGYAEVWAKTIPDYIVTVPIVTHLVNAGNGKGITNAASGLVSQSVTRDKIAQNAVSDLVITSAIYADAWLENNGTFEAIVTFDIQETDKVIIDSNTPAWSAVTNCHIENNQLRFIAKIKPTIDIPLNVLVIRR